MRPGLRLGAAALALAALCVGEAGCAASRPPGEGALVGTSGLPPGAPAAPERSPACPVADGVGTVPPGVAIYSITFTVNGREQIIRDGQGLEVEPGDRVVVARIEICAAEAGAAGGQVCVDVAPMGALGGAIRSQAWGSHLQPVAPGFTTVPGPSGTWRVEAAWQGFTAVVNHWPAGRTPDAGCAEGSCERDDYLVVFFD